MPGKWVTLCLVVAQCDKVLKLAGKLGQVDIGV